MSLSVAETSPVRTDRGAGTSTMVAAAGGGVAGIAAGFAARGVGSSRALRAGVVGLLAFGGAGLAASTGYLAGGQPLGPTAEQIAGGVGAAGVIAGVAGMRGDPRGFAFLGVLGVISVGAGLAALATHTALTN